LTIVSDDDDVDVSDMHTPENQGLDGQGSRDEAECSGKRRRHHLMVPPYRTPEAGTGAWSDSGS
jgi:hypothetical protein